MRRFFTLAFSLLIFFDPCISQVAQWNSTVGTGSTGVTAGTATLGAGLNETGVSACGNGVFTTNGIWETGDVSPTDAADALADDEYIEFPITANAGYNITITSMTFSGQKSNTGGKNTGLYNGTTDVSNGGITWTGTDCETRTITLFPSPLVINSGETASMNLYVWGATGSTGSWRVGSVKFFGSVALPVQFSFFNVENNNLKSKLNFSTASETNNSHFTIERSADARDFESIGEIKGAGNSSRELSYEFIDENPLPGINYYRIKQTDYDGKFSYSEIRSVRHKGLSHVSVTPRTTEGRLDIVTDLDDYTLAIYNAAGQEVKRLIDMSLDQSISIETLHSGIYFVRIYSGSHSETVRIVKM